MIAWSTPEHPDPARREPERLGVSDFMAVILFPGLAPEGEILTDGPCVQYKDPEAQP